MASIAQRAFSSFFFGDRSSPLHTEDGPKILDERSALDILESYQSSNSGPMDVDAPHSTQKRGTSTASEQAAAPKSLSSSTPANHATDKVNPESQTKSRDKESPRHSYVHATYSSAIRNTRHQGEVDVLKAEIRELREMSEKRERYIGRMQDKYREFAASLEQSHTALEASNRNAQTLQNQLTHEQARREEAEKLIKARRRELQEAQAYLETSDSMSAQEVVGLIKAVNSEIFQFAASVAETASPPASIPNTNSAALDELKKLVGPNLLAILGCHSIPDADPVFLLQTAIQVALLGMTCQWTRLFSAVGHHGIRAAYNSILSSTPQSVTARWRALVFSRHKYEEPTQAFEKLRGKLTATAATVVQTLGYTVSGNAMSGITSITEAIIKLDRAAGEAALSQNLSVAGPVPGKPFKSKDMEDVNGGEGTAKENDIVVCCIELGLSCTERGDDGTMTTGRLLLKPKVLLESAFYDH